MKTKLFSLFLMLVISIGTLLASETQVDGIWYDFKSSTLTAEVTYHGASHEAYSNEYSGAVTIPDSVTYSNKTYRVTSIGEYAFWGCPRLISVTIPNSVTSIGYGAFSVCTGLTSVTIPNSVTNIENYAFSGCAGLTFIEIPNSVTSIGEYAFRGCSGLTSIEIPNSVTSIGNAAFNYCTSLSSVEIPNSVTNIKGATFWYCSSLTSVIIPNSVTSIGDQAFGYCTRLKSITVEAENPPILGNKVFDNVNTSNILFYVPTASIPAYQAATQWNSFRISDITFVINGIRYCLYDSTLTASVVHDDSYTGDIVIPSSVTYGNILYGVTSIGNYAFLGCNSLTSITIPNSVTSIGESACSSCSSLTSVTIPNSITYIEKKAFQGCTSLSHFEIPNSVTGIGSYAFQSCTSLSSIEIPNSVISIEVGAFNACTSLTSVTIPNSVTSIGSSPFQGCNNLTGIYATCGDLARIKSLLKNDNRVKYAPLPYALTVNARNGAVSIPQNICDVFELTATPNYGYHFTQWSDGVTDNPRAFVLTQDTTFSVEFEKNPTITYIYDRSAGSVYGATQLAYDTVGEITFEATPKYGYYFVQWSDGVTDNPRTIILTQDTTFTAEFAIDKSGTCGKDSALIWSYEDKSQTLTITGNGALTENYTFGVEAPTQMKTLIIGDEVTSIGDSVFYNTSNLNHLFIGANVASIGKYTFAECKNFDDITCYATTVPTIDNTTFYNVGNKQYIYLYVPEDRERAYKRDTYWGQFDIQIKGAEETTTDGSVVVVPTDNTVEITWPSVSEAETYEIVITKEGEVVCTLIFNANGQLAGIAFVPGRNGAHTQQAQTAGFKFTVTGLNSGTQYGYSIDSKDAGGQTLDSKSGSFTTTVEGNPIECIEDVLSIEKATKLLHNGQILILLGEKVYTVTGQEVR